MTQIGTRTVALLALALCGLAPGAASASPTAPERPAPLPTLVSVHARHVGAVDRVVFRFTGGTPGDVSAAWVDTLVSDGWGRRVRAAGAEVLAVYLNGADAHDEGGSSFRPRTAFALPNVITAVSAGDFEGTVTVGLGVQQHTSYTVRTRADEVVVDVAAGFPTAVRQVWFVDRDAVATGTTPYAVPVGRRLPAAAPAAAVLHALFAGPTPGETHSGLGLVRSRAWGFTDLEIAGGTARLRLTRGCGSGGSTVTVADELRPTLRQFPTVDWVKIYAPGGGTGQPSGSSDSIPACLEP